MSAFMEIVSFFTSNYLSSSSKKQPEKQEIEEWVKKGDMQSISSNLLHSYLYMIAAENGHLTVIQWLYEQNIPFESSDNFEQMVASSLHASQANRDEFLRFLHELGSPWSLYLIASEKGYLDIIKWLYEQLEIPFENPNSEIHVGINLMARAVDGGFIDILQYLHTHGCDWNSIICSHAACYGKLDCLRYLHENGCEWDSLTTTGASRNGHLDCLIYAHENGCEWRNPFICSDAAWYGHLDCLIYAREHGCDWTFVTCRDAARNGHLHCLVYAHENGCAWNAETCWYAAGYGQLDCLRYAHEHGCEWDFQTPKHAVWKGNLDCLIYAHENGCEWTKDTCIVAAKYGQLECLQYAVENGCNTEGALFEAAKSGHMNCFYYLYSVDPILNGSCWNYDFAYPNEFVDLFDLDDKMWRDALFSHELQNHPLLKERVDIKKCKLYEQLQACKEGLHKYVSNDVIQHVICTYL